MRSALSSVAPALLCLSLCVAFPPVSRAGCPDGGISPAVAPPQVREGATIWTDLFGPAKSGQYHAKRDSTTFAGVLTPGLQSGQELFHDVAIVGDRLFALYNYGIQVWDISGAANAKDPLLKQQVDGWMGHWWDPQMAGEDDYKTNNISAVQDPLDSNRVLVVVAGDGTVGTTIWEYLIAQNGLTQLSQHYLEGYELDVAFFGTTPYAFVGTLAGVHAYNVKTQTYLGVLGAGTGRSQFVSAIERDGVIYVMSSHGVTTGPRIFRVPSPQTPGTATIVWSDSNTAYKGNELFEKDGHYYAAFIRENAIRLYLVDDCLDANGCSNLTARSVARAVPGATFGTHLVLRVSEANGTPFLYQGYDTGPDYHGRAMEGLFSLANLQSSGPQLSLVEITENPGFQTYTSCEDGVQLNYWGDMTSQNPYGFNRAAGRYGEFNGNYFYRAAWTVLDVHAYDGTPPDPTLTLSISPPQTTYWLDEDIDFVVSTTNCPAAAPYDWDATGDFFESGLGTTTNTYSWDLCPSANCDTTEQVTVTALGCSPNPSDFEALDLEDPRPVVTGIDATQTQARGASLDQCAPTQLSALLSQGRTGALTYLWTAVDEACEEWNVERGGLLDCEIPLVDGNGDDVSTDASPVWAAENLQGDLLFVDGFESGTTSRWGAAPVPAVRVGVVSTYVDSLLNPHPSSFEEVFSFDPAPAPAFGGGGLGLEPGDDGDDGQLDMVVDATAFEYRWEIEDAGGTDTCEFSATRGAGVPCTVLEWDDPDSGPELTYTWSLEDGNQTGTKRARVTIRTCPGGSVASRENGWSVTPASVGPAPIVQSFFIPADQISLSGPVGNLPCYKTSAIDRDTRCKTGVNVPFVACTLGDEDPDEFEVDWDGDGPGGTTSEPVLVGDANDCPGGQDAWNLNESWGSEILSSFQPTVEALRGGDPHPDSPGPVELDQDLVIDNAP